MSSIAAEETVAIGKSNKMRWFFLIEKYNIITILYTNGIINAEFN